MALNRASDMSAVDWQFQTCKIIVIFLSFTKGWKSPYNTPVYIISHFLAELTSPFLRNKVEFLPLSTQSLTTNSVTLSRA